MKRLYIVGAGGHGGVACSVASEINIWSDIYFVDTNYPNLREKYEKPIVASTLMDVTVESNYDCYIAIGDNWHRERVFNEAVTLGFNMCNIISRHAYIAKSAQIGRGVLVMPKSIINNCAKISDGVIVNSGAIVEHDCRVGGFCHVGPKAAMGGFVSVGDRTWLGLGSNIIHGIKIGEDVIVGAGSTVLGDLKSLGTYVGSPARKIKDRSL